MSDVSSDIVQQPGGKSRIQLIRYRTRPDLGNPLAVVLKTVAICLTSQALASVVIVFFLSAMHPGIDPSDLLQDSILGQFFYVLMAEGLAAVSVFWFLRRRRMSLGFIGLGRRPKLSDLWRAAGGFIAFYALLIVASVVLSSFFPSVNTDQKQQLGFDNIVGGRDNILALISLVILPPLGEEPLVRGYLFSGLRARLRFWPAALITSILFGVAHLEFGTGEPLLWAAAIDTFLLSMILVYLRNSTGALYAGIFVHLLNNLVAFGIHFK